MDSSKKFKKGDVIAKEGDKLENILYVKSGRILLYQERNEKKIEIMNVTQGRLVGEYLAFGDQKLPYSIQAMTMTEIFEVPAKLAQERYNTLDTVMKFVMKGLSDSLGDIRNEIKSMKLEQDASPCPQKMIPRIFGAISMIMRNTGKVQEDKTIIVPWESLKIYSQRYFLENPAKILNAIEIYKKLGYADIIYRKNEDGLDELYEIKFINTVLVEGFPDFYQFYFYKPGKQEIIHAHKNETRLVKTFLKLAKEKNIQMDHRGAMNLDYEEVMKYVKEQLGLELNSNHLGMIEKNGILMQRRSRDKGVFLGFDKRDAEQTLTYWEVLLEIDKWNTKGIVDLNEKEEETNPNKKKKGSSCPSCTTECPDGAKFCLNCGTKLAG